MVLHPHGAPASAFLSAGLTNWCYHDWLSVLLSEGGRLKPAASSSKPLMDVLSVHSRAGVLKQLHLRDSKNFLCHSLYT